MKRILIVGGGASGMVTGIFAKREDNEVIILERNSSPLKKLLITGNGKCNYLNEVYHEDCYHSMNMEVVREILTNDNLVRVREFFDSLGIIPKLKNGYYYPFSNQASTIQYALIEKAKECGVELIENTCVTKIEKKDNVFIVYSHEKVWEVDVLVLATGSYAYPKTGSDGMGYQFLKDFHHTIIKPLPALVQLVGKGNYFKEWDGVRTDVELSLWEDDKLISQEMGEVQLTDYGISGICTFNLSHFVTRGLDVHKKEMIHINFVPFITGSIQDWLYEFSKKHSTKNLEKLLGGFLNRKLIHTIFLLMHLSKDIYYQDLSLEEQKLLCKYLGEFPVEIIGTKDFSSCQICNGGVKLTEIHSKTMESTLVPNLYIVGELLDMNGNCGGYNLTECWLTGMLAGRSIGDYQ